MKIGLRQANQQFSKAIRAVRAGQEVLLTERGRPIAVIRPMARGPSEEAVLDAMAAEGLISLPVRRGRLRRRPWRPVKVKGKPVSVTIIEDREDRARSCGRTSTRAPSSSAMSTRWAGEKCFGCCGDTMP
jgi:prevent-host-death family protein